jgi:hypothetical protein
MSERSSSDRWAEEFLLAYRAHRIDDQMAYYARRAEDNERARREALWVSAICLVLSALFGALATADERRRQIWAVIAAGFGALATAVGAYEAAFGFERLSRQYEDTRGALHIADVRGPQEDEPAELDSAELLRFVDRVEAILRSEVDSWSQLTSRTGQQPDEAEEDTRQPPFDVPRAGP